MRNTKPLLPSPSAFAVAERDPDGSSHWLDLDLDQEDADLTESGPFNLEVALPGRW